jgi:hypothetical protein
VIEEAAEHLRVARELTDRQRSLVARFESEGLDTFAERTLLHTFENVLRLEEARMGRLVYEDALARARKNQ